MRIRQYDPEKDLGTLEQWFKDWKWSMWDKDAISPFSYFIELDGKPLVFSSYYRTVGTNMANMGFTIGDIDIDRSLRKEATNLVLDHIFNECEEIGVRYLYYSTDNASKAMVNKFEEKGAIITDPGDAWNCVKTFGVDTADFLNE